MASVEANHAHTHNSNAQQQGQRRPQERRNRRGGPGPPGMENLSLPAEQTNGIGKQHDQRGQNRKPPPPNKSGPPRRVSLSDDTATIQSHVNMMEVDLKSLEGELLQYRRELDKRSELTAVRAELEKTKLDSERAHQESIAFQQFHQSTVNNLNSQLEAATSLANEQETQLKSCLEECQGLRERIMRSEEAFQNEAHDNLLKADEIEDLLRIQTNERAKNAQLQEQNEREIKSLTEKIAKKDEEIASLNALLQAGEAEKRASQQGKVDQTSRIEFLEKTLDRAAQERTDMETHYKGECSRLCLQIDGLEVELRRPISMVAGEVSLVGLIRSLISASKESSMPMDKLMENVQDKVWPNKWERHYANRLGSIPDFIASHPEAFSIDRETSTVSCLETTIHFGAGPFQSQAAEHTQGNSGKRPKTSEERTMGPSDSEKSLLSRLQQQGAVKTSSDPAEDAERDGQTAEAPRIRSGHGNPANAAPGRLPATLPPFPVVVTPMNEFLSKAHSTGIADPGKMPDGSRAPRQRGWSTSLTSAPPQKDAPAQNTTQRANAQQEDRTANAAAPNAGSPSNGQPSPKRQKNASERRTERNGRSGRQTNKEQNTSGEGQEDTMQPPPGFTPEPNSKKRQPRENRQQAERDDFGGQFAPRDSSRQQRRPQNEKSQRNPAQDGNKTASSDENQGKGNQDKTNENGTHLSKSARSRANKKKKQAQEKSPEPGPSSDGQQ